MSNEPAEYLVRGALLVCNCGSHPRRVNLPECHGVYTKDHPILRKDDCVPETNISYFGVCLGETPPKDAKEVRLAPYAPEGQESTGEDVQGPKCTPDLIGSWKNTHDATKISGESPAVTTNSYLICRCGGIIQPYTSGQEYEDKK